jgi:diguanylate cyclase (GGDEF)-like protein
LLAILEPLLQSAGGKAVFQHVSLLLENIQTTALETQNAHTDLFRELLDILSCYAPSEPSFQTHLQLLRQHLGSPLNATELQQLRTIIRSIARQSGTQTPAPLQDPITASLENLATSYSREPAATKAPQQDNEPLAATTPIAPRRIDEDKDLRVDQAYRRHLDDKRDRIQHIQQTLGEQVNSIIKQNEEFGVLLEVEYESLRHSENMTDLQNLRQALVSEVEKLLKGNHSLTSKLDKAKNYLKIIESEGQHLNDELTRVHILSLTDDLTGLSNRRAFMRRLEDEVSRVQRYGSPLSLGLIDMDLFKSINDKLGHPAGDEVLRTFSNNILSIFRHHDMVARYGGEEFAILLPNTDIEGSLRAMEKVKARTATSQFQIQGEMLPMPTFSAGLALYKPGETTGDLIERADKALFRAKDLGRNRVEIAPSDNPATKKDSSLRPKS